MLKRWYLVLVCLMILVPASSFPVRGDMKLPSFKVGDEWVYSVNLNLEGMAVISGDWTFRVDGELNISGYDVYNMSIDGSGPASLSGFGSGSYLAEGYSYLTKDGLSLLKESLMISITVTITEPMNMVIYMNTTNTPPVNQFDFPIREGDAWTSLSTTSSEFAILSNNPFFPGSVANSTEALSTDFECVSKETVEVPAGRFSSYRIKVSEESGNTTYIYISTRSGYIVKTQMYNSTGASIGNLNLKSYSYTPPAQGGGDSISDIMEYLWLLITLIVIISVLLFISAYISHRSKKREKAEEGETVEETNK